MSIEKKYRVVDLRSDTLSLPPPEMRRAMFEAEVGDDVYEEDPTVRALEARVAQLFGKQAALFVCSGTMANLIAIMVHCRHRGSEAIVGNRTHLFNLEVGGPAALAGVQINPIENKLDGTFDLEELKGKIRGSDIHEAITEVVCVENTHNVMGGKVLPLDWLDQLAAICRGARVKLHMDGARVFSAASYLRVPVARVVQDFDSVSFCLSKNLACPAGSLVVGTTSFIKEARRMRKALGGGMRQVGFLAAAGLYALDHVVPRLDEDHARARRIAQAVHDMKSPNFRVDIDSVQTNIFMIYANSPTVNMGDFKKRLLAVDEKELREGVVDKDGKGIVLKLSSRSLAFARCVTYLQTDDESVELAVKKLQYVIREYDENVK